MPAQFFSSACSATAIRKNDPFVGPNKNDHHKNTPFLNTLRALRKAGENRNKGFGTKARNAKDFVISSGELNPFVSQSGAAALKAKNPNKFMKKCLNARIQSRKIGALAKSRRPATANPFATKDEIGRELLRKLRTAMAEQERSKDEIGRELLQKLRAGIAEREASKKE